MMKDILDAREWLTMHQKWNNLLGNDFDAEDLANIFQSYERALVAVRDEADQHLREVKEQHLKEIAQLTGRIGALQRKLNQETK